MTRLAVLLVVLVLVPAAAAAYPTPFAVQGEQIQLPALDGKTWFVATKDGANTRLATIGAQRRSATVKGAFGIPTITQNGLVGGLFHDGSALVLQSVGLHATSQFAIVRTSDLAVRDTIALDGTFGFDALSPDGSTLYLIQHSTAYDLQNYVVRAYDLRTHALRPGTIADKTQRGWTMQGWAVARTATQNGRWVYTLYANPGGYPFVHALDTVRGVAHCVGLPWQGADQAVWGLRLAVAGSSLKVIAQSGVTWRLVDRATWKLTTPP